MSCLNRVPLCLLTAVFCACSLSCSPAAEPTAAPGEATKQEQKPSAPTIQVTNRQDLRTRVGQTVTIVGDVDRIGKSSSGHRFINFTGNDEFSVFIASQDVNQFKDGPPEKIYDGKSISVRGTVERFRGKLQIQVRTPKAIELVEQPRGPPGDEALKPVKLTPAGPDVWTSPAGLRYAGRDPEGLTRKDHVLRHAKDIPNRDGPHGVFDGGEELTFAWIDAAWRQIERDKLPRIVDGGRETYTVRMNRRVGYLGGKSGAARRNPPLTRIFIVVRKGTKDVITAFPK